jgi:hypothetical protein
MGKKIVSVILVLFFVVYATGCSTHIHTVGSGGKNASTVEARQWYVLWGLVPINNVDSKAMAGDAANYTIKTQASFLDLVISAVAGIVTVNCRSVSVTK